MAATWKENGAHKRMMLLILDYYNINKLVNGDFLGYLSPGLLE